MPNHFTEKYSFPERPGAPPCPIVTRLRFVNPKTGKEKTTTAIIDTAADLTCLPASYVDYLNLLDPDLVGLGVVVNKIYQPTFMLTVEIEDVVRDDFEVTHLPESLESDDDDEVEKADTPLLGRDVLNRFHVFLRPTDGERGEFDIINPMSHWPWTRVDQR